MVKLKGLFSRIKDLILRGIEMFGEARVPVYAGYATLFIVTAIFPCLMLIISIVNLLPGFSANDVADILLQILPDLGSIRELIESMILNIQGQSDGVLASVAAVTTLWSASNGVHAMQQGLDQMDCTGKNEAEKEDSDLKEKGGNAVRSFLKRLFFTLIMIILIPALLVFEMLGDSVSSDICSAIEKVNPETLNNILTSIDSFFHISSLVVMVFAFLVILQIYAKLPEKQRKLKSQIPGAVVACIGWLLFTKLFSFFIPRIYHASSLYGSLASLFLLLLWLRFFIIILFAGKILNHALEEEKELNIMI